MSQQRVNSPGQRLALVFQEALPVIGCCMGVNERSFILQCREKKINLNFTSQRKSWLLKASSNQTVGMRETHHKLVVPERASAILCLSRNTRGKELLKPGELIPLIAKAEESCRVLPPPSPGRSGASGGRQSNACPAQAKGEGHRQPL